MSGELPRGWVNTTIGEINDYSSCNIDPLKEPEQVFELYSVPIYPTGRPEYVRGQDIGSTKQSVEPGDVLLCKINPRINRVWMVGPKSEWPQIGSSEWVVIRQPLIHAGFLRYQLSESSFREKLCSEVSGVGGSLTRAQPKKVATYSLVLPPAAEQTRIAAKLDELLAQVDTLKARIDGIPALLKRFRQSVLAAAVSGRLTEEWRAGQVAPSTSNESVTPEWAQTVFGEICREITVGYVGKMADQYRDEGVPFLRSQNVRPMRFSPENILHISEEFHSSILKSRLEPGDLAIVRSGAPGVTCVIPKSLPIANCSDLVIARPSEKLNSWFGCIYMNSEVAKRNVADNQVGVAQQHFNVGSMKKMPIRLPTLEEQTEIVRRVEQLFAFADQLEAKVASAKNRIDRLTQSILAKAFRGELVPQDPNDEPASVLLERIKAQRAAAPKAKRGRKASA